MNIPYGVIPIIPTDFKNTITITPTELLNVNPISPKFCCLTNANRLPTKAILFLQNPPIKSDKIIKYDGELIYECKIATIPKNSVSGIIINEDFPTYEELKTTLSSVKSVIPITVSTKFISDSMNDKNIQSLLLKQYGLCRNESSSTKMLTLLNYYIDTDILRKQTSIKPLSIETNSICDTKDTISNSFGSVLWLLDFLFQLSLGNVSRCYVDMGSYNNIYAILAFQWATRQNAELFSIPKQSVQIYITKNITDYFITVIHKSMNEENVQIHVELPTTSTGHLMRLESNQGIEGISGICLGNLTFQGTTDGSPININTKQSDNNFSVIPVEYNNGYTFIVGKYSAVLLKVPILSTGGVIYNSSNNISITMQNDPMNAKTFTTMRNYKKYHKE